MKKVKRLEVEKEDLRKIDMLKFSKKHFKIQLFLMVNHITFY